MANVNEVRVSEVSTNVADAAAMASSAQAGASIAVNSVVRAPTKDSGRVHIGGALMRF